MSVVRADACVIGTGAGGAPVAKELAEGGMSVVMLEEGPDRGADDVTARPREMTASLYRDAGQLATVGNVPIVLPLGSGIGGTTFVNSGTCFRTPDAVLERWATDFGLDGMSPPELDPFFARVEEEIGVTQVPPDIAGNNAHVVRRGAERLGWSGDFIRRNARGCVGARRRRSSTPASPTSRVRGRRARSRTPDAAREGSSCAAVAPAPSKRATSVSRPTT